MSFCLLNAQRMLRCLISGAIVSMLVVGGGFAAAVVASSTAQAKTPGSTYCFYRKCHRVKTLRETRALIGKPIALFASHYDYCGRDRYNPCGLTSSGEPFFPERPDNAASPIYPDGTVLLVRNSRTKASAVVRINNAGPYWGNRKLDLSKAAAQRLGFARQGVAKLETKIVAAPTRGQSRYSYKRRYRPLPGFIGQQESLNEAHETMTAILAVEALAGSFLSMGAGGVVASAHGEPIAVQRQRVRVAARTNAVLEDITSFNEMTLIPVAAVRKPKSTVKPVKVATRTVAPDIYDAALKKTHVVPRPASIAVVKSESVGAAGVDKAQRFVERGLPFAIGVAALSPKAFVISRKPRLPRLPHRKLPSDSKCARERADQA